MPPERMSAPKPEDTKPSNFIAVFWWVVFIIPVAFTWYATQSFLIVGIIIGIRIVVMFIPKGWFGKKATPVIARTDTTSKTSSSLKKPQPPVEVIEKVNVVSNLLTPYKDELISECKGLLKMLRIYDHDKEDRYLNDYRQFRGWK